MSATSRVQAPKPCSSQATRPCATCATSRSTRIGVP